MPFLLVLLLMILVLQLQLFYQLVAKATFKLFFSSQGFSSNNLIALPQLTETIFNRFSFA